MSSSQAPQKCGNCNKDAPLKCSRCAKVHYCSAECQKAHYPTHKALCKKASPPSPPPSQLIPIGDPQAAFAQLQSLKEQQQKAMEGKSSKDAINLGMQALNIALQLNFPGVHNELAQLYHNLSHLHMVIEQPDEADKFGANALANSELQLKSTPDKPQALELHSVILIADAHRKIIKGDLSAAEKPSLKALEIAEGIFGGDSPGLVKTLRACAMLRERQNNLDDAEMYLKRAYNCMHKVHGLLHPGVQLVVDEIVQVQLKNNKIKPALELAESSYKEATENVGEEHAITLDCAQRLSQVYCRSDKYDEAEALVDKTMGIRIKLYGLESVPVAAALASLASIRDTKGQCDLETEQMVGKALEIFHQHEGENSNNFRSALGLLGRIREKRKLLGQGDGLDGTVMDTMEPDSALTKVARAGMLMSNATLHFRDSKFTSAELLLEEALEIYVAENGPNHPSSKTAAQNLGITRRNIILQLWQEVAQEEISLKEARKNSGWGEEEEEESYNILGEL